MTVFTASDNVHCNDRFYEYWYCGLQVFVIKMGAVIVESCWSSFKIMLAMHGQMNAKIISVKERESVNFQSVDIH